MTSKGFELIKAATLVEAHPDNILRSTNLIAAELQFEKKNIIVNIIKKKIN